MGEGISEDVVRIPLRARNGSIRACVTVDAADADFVNQWRWSLGSHGYARRAERVGGYHKSFLLHRELLGLGPGDPREGDHRNHDKLDCRRSNLRILPPGGNAQNKSSHRGSTSKHRGVSWSARSRKWVVHVRANGKVLHLGYFSDEEEAAKVAQESRKRLMQYATE